MMIGNRNSGAGQLLRVLLQAVDDSGPQQLVKVTGLAGQTLGEAVRAQHFGFSSNPPAGGEGLATLIGGGMDRAHVLGLEHPQYRPTNLPSGGVIVYDYEGNLVKVVHGNLLIKHGTKIVLQGAGNSLTIDQAGFHFAGGQIDHDGHRIDKTHVHTNVSPGGGESGPPP